MHPLAKDPGREGLRVSADRGRLERCLHGFETSDCPYQAFFRLLGEPESDRLAADCLASTAGIESDHRSPRCHGFDRQDAEVFFTGEDQGTATGQMVAQDVEGLVAQEL